MRLGTAGWGTEEEDGNEAKQTHLHCVGFSCPCLPIGKDTDIVAINAGGDQGLNLLKHLGETEQSEEKVAASPLTPAVRNGSTHLLLGCLWGEDFIQLKGHLLSFVQEVQDSVIISIEGHSVGCLRALPILLCDGADSSKNTDVSLGERTGNQPSNTGVDEASCSQPNPLMGTLPCPSCPTLGTPRPAHL